MKIKTYTKRKGKENPLRDAAILLRTINRLRNYDLIPKGVYHFASHEEADQWMLKQIAHTHALQNSKT